MISDDPSVSRQPSGPEILILAPVFDDWDAAAVVLRELDRALCSRRMVAKALLLNDGSSIPPSLALPDCFVAVRSLDILHLRRNLGHQRAIAVGLVYALENINCDAVLLMDADGEDRPEDVPVLIEKFLDHGQQYVIFAERARRVEGVVFRLFYNLYCWVHWLLVGIRVRVGNFSILPRPALQRLVVSAEIWNHYAAAVFRSRIAFKTVSLDRGKRISGRSRMNFISLVAHGLSAISVFGEVVGARLLTLSVLLIMVPCAAAVILGIGHVANLRVPLWAAYATGISGLILLQAAMVSFILALLLLNSRANSNFLPIRDCPPFIGAVERILPPDA